MSVQDRPPISSFMTITARRLDPATIVISEKVRSYCKYPYPMPNPTHPDGCPNYGRHPLCPPRAPFRPEILTMYDTFVLVWTKFDITAYTEMMRKRMHEKGLEWTEKQLRNSRLWQSSVKSKMKIFIHAKFPRVDEILGAGTGFTDCQSMESAGINVFATLVKNKIPFDKKAKEYITLVALLLIDSRKPRTKVDKL